MEDSKKYVLVPCDFTQVAEYALEHAIVVSKITNNDIALIHIVKKEKEIKEAQEKLDNVAEKASKEHDIPVKAIVKEGSIFTSIGETAEEIDADLVIMGTHGMKGLQKITGSWALKVIVSSKVPFVIVQGPVANNRFKNIVFPVDFKKENKEKHSWVHYLSKHYNSKFHIIKPNTTDSGLLKMIKSNIIFARNYFDSKGIDYEINTAPGKADFAIETINFAKEVNADLILIMTTKDIGFTDYVLGAHEQYIIANSAKIPVMCINPMPSKLSGFYAMGG